MTREQTQQVLLNLKKAYPFFYKDIGPDEGEERADLWYEMFEDDDVALVVKAVKLFLKSIGFRSRRKRLNAINS